MRLSGFTMIYKCVSLFVLKESNIILSTVVLTTSTFVVGCLPAAG